MTTDKRDLHADLAICNAATAGPWGWGVDNGESLLQNSRGVPVVFISEPGITDADARFIAEARTGWPHAIERALTAEELCAHQGRSILALAERNRELKVEVERLRGVLEYFAVSPIFRFVESPHSLRQMAQMALRKEATADDQC
ncbi:hypothetical protein [Brevibacillus borstelensis]|uniref:hypothetical protein n=1 Tax=Brevibacillus borstelensis TaxID=45462 RepID=UPI00287FA083|nr:hypothetical protein [Brevibacillus borstelensis]WNF07427.1 hypothetical protein RFB14_08470 [Brevibacillus borstelensis]